MQSPYEINVAERVQEKPPRYQHLFAIHERSCVSEEQLIHVYDILKEKFPHPQFELSVTYREYIIHQAGIDIIAERVARSNQRKRTPTRKHTPSAKDVEDYYYNK